MRCGRTDRGTSPSTSVTLLDEATTLESQTNQKIRYVLGQTLTLARATSVDVLRKFVAELGTNVRFRLADKVVGGREPGEVGHSLKVPDDDAWFHAKWNMTRRAPSRNLLRRIRCQFDRLQN